MANFERAAFGGGAAQRVICVHIPSSHSLPFHAHIQRRTSGMNSVARCVVLREEAADLNEPEWA